MRSMVEGAAKPRASADATPTGQSMRAPPETIADARRLRRSLSPPEARLWGRLRARAPGTPVFRRQHPVGPYVLDFYCGKARLAVEIDGMSTTRPIGRNVTLERTRGSEDRALR